MVLNPPAPTGSPRRPGPPPWLGGDLAGFALAGGGAALTVGLALAGLAAPLQLAFPAACLVAGVLLLARRQWQAYLAFTLALWLLAPELRRIVDWRSDYTAMSLVNITPALVSLLALPWALAARRRVQRSIATAFTVATVVMGYAFLVGVLRNGPLTASADVVQLVAPLALGLYVLTVPEDDAALRRTVHRWAVWGGLLVGGYAVVQFLVLPAWDREWMVDAGVTTLGDPEPREVRAFATLGTANYLAQFTVVAVLLGLAERRLLVQVAAVGAALVALGLSLTRAGWIGVVVGVVALLLLGRWQAWRIVAVAAAAFLVLWTQQSPIAEKVVDRFEETRFEGKADDSLLARYGFQSAIAAHVLTDPVGQGMGSTGRAALVDGGEDLPAERFAHFDSGIFEPLVRYGAVGGTALLGAVGLAIVAAVRRGRHGSLFDACAAASLVALGVATLFLDVERGIFGVLLWTLLAMQARPPAGGSPARAR